MDIKRKYVDLVQAAAKDVYNLEGDKISKVANIFGKCMDNGGVVQLYGVDHGEEFVNELFYRAGGIAPYHAYKLRDLVLKGLYDQKKIDSREVYEDLSVIDKFETLYQLDDRDMYCLVSFYGNQPIVIEIAKRAKAKGQKVVAVVNKSAYDSCGGTLLEYADEWLDMNAGDDVALEIDGHKVGQTSSTVTNIIAQMITAEVYKYYKDSNREAPVLLSANVAGADVHNNALTDPYQRRVR